MEATSKLMSQIILGSILLLCLFAPSIAQAPIKEKGNQPSTEIDLKVNQIVIAKIVPKLPILVDEQINNYMQKLGDRMANAIPLEYRRPEFSYTFKVIDFPVIAVYALPGGSVYISRGLFERARNEGELAGPIAHCISHIVLRHYINKLPLADKIRWQELEDGILNTFIADSLLTVEGSKRKFGKSKYSLKLDEAFEKEADMIAAQIIVNAGYDPRDLGNIWNTIGFDHLNGGNCFSDTKTRNRKDFIYQTTYVLQSFKEFDQNKVRRKTKEFVDIRERIRNLPHMTNSIIKSQ